MAKKHGNYDLYGGYSHYTPGFTEIIWILILFLVGIILGSGVTLAFTYFYGKVFATQYGILVAYPIQFLPAMMYAGIKSRNAMFFDKGYALISNHYKPVGLALCALLVVVMTFCASFMADLFSSIMPPMPDSIKEALENTTADCPLWVSLLSVSVMAPIFEEWLCRGMFLRGMLNFHRKDGRRGVHPAWAIVISALLFALIHANPWQAVPAFIIGCLLGYVYWRTGSLWLTMLMHCFNNTLAVVMSRIDTPMKDAETWLDVMTPWQYGIAFVACAIILILGIRAMQRIPMQDEHGNCDEIAADEMA